MSDENATTWPCPKDGASMQPMGRRGRGGAWRCPDCHSIFIDAGAMRRGRLERPPVWLPILMSVFWSLLATVVVRRLRRGRSQKVPA